MNPMRPLLVLAALALGTGCAASAEKPATAPTTTTTVRYYSGLTTTTRAMRAMNSDRDTQYIPPMERYADCLERFPQHICALELER